MNEQISNGGRITEFSMTVDIQEALKAFKHLKIPKRRLNRNTPDLALIVRCEGRRATFAIAGLAVGIPCQTSGDFEIQWPGNYREQMIDILNTYPDGKFIIRAKNGELSISPENNQSTTCLKSPRIFVTGGFL